MTAKCYCCDELYPDDRLGTVCRYCGRGVIEPLDSAIEEYRGQDSGLDSDD